MLPQEPFLHPTSIQPDGAQLQLHQERGREHEPDDDVDGPGDVEQAGPGVPALAGAGPALPGQAEVTS